MANIHIVAQPICVDVFFSSYALNLLVLCVRKE